MIILEQIQPGAVVKDKNEVFYLLAQRVAGRQFHLVSFKGSILEVWKDTLLVEELNKRGFIYQYRIT